MQVLQILPTDVWVLTRKTEARLYGRQAGLVIQEMCAQYNEYRIQNTYMPLSAERQVRHRAPQPRLYNQ